jgi:hypothetical protein
MKIERPEQNQFRITTEKEYEARMFMDCMQESGFFKKGSVEKLRRTGEAYQ